MKNLVTKVAVTGLIVSGLALVCTGALAQQVRMADAAHKGNFNYLRTAPDHRAHIIEKMRHGTRFQVVVQQGDYYAVILANGTHGWTASANVHFL